ncbi:MAG: M23 family metallopeptidase [Gammaproteobacteria bacterium]|nr:M23 family metallopeptidase [Gammaproteobacteria bacterium]
MVAMAAIVLLASGLPASWSAAETVSRAPSGDVWVREQDAGDAVRLVLVNEHFAPVHVAWHLSEMENTSVDGVTAGTLVVAPRAERGLVTVRGARPGAWGFRYHFHFLHGDPLAEHAADAVYRPPFKPGARFRITQAWPDVFTHDDVASHHAIDVAMPEGAPVHAARAGVVFEVADGFEEGGLDAQRLASAANFVRVLHDDGSMALYAHLAPGSINVQPGHQVSTGALLGAAGSTGFSTGPHLHFAVQLNTPTGLVSVPVVFRGPQDSQQSPRRGDWLAAPP